MSRDFSYSGVSEEFPYKIFKKISSNIFDNKDILEKVDYQGYLPLRTQISEYLDKSRGFKADPSQIVISSGSEYLFQIIFKLISGKFGIEDPGYNMLSNIMDTNDINYEFISVDENGMDLTKLKKLSSLIVNNNELKEIDTKELKDLEEQEKEEMLLAVNMKKSALDNLIISTYEILNLATFFTVGKDEVKAWTYKKGMTAKECAGLIHSDIQKGFIKAEIYNYKDLMEYPDENILKEKGKIRIEGKDYIMQDGDICFFKFNV